MVARLRAFVAVGEAAVLLARTWGMLAATA
jgi:hypothetical protein